MCFDYGITGIQRNAVTWFEGKKMSCTGELPRVIVVMARRPSARLGGLYQPHKTGGCEPTGGESVADYKPDGTMDTKMSILYSVGDPKDPLATINVSIR